MDQYPFEQPGTVDEQLEALSITLQPCPSWCDGDHFGPPPIALSAEDGFFHHGPVTVITDDSASLDDSCKEEKLRLGLLSWVPTLTATASRTYVCLGNGGDCDYHFTPESARRLAAELTRLANQAGTG